jgi:hypothetical protein
MQNFTTQLDTDPCVARFWSSFKYTIQIDRIKKELKKEINKMKKEYICNLHPFANLRPHNYKYMQSK